MQIERLPNGGTRYVPDAHPQAPRTSRARPAGLSIIKTLVKQAVRRELTSRAWAEWIVARAVTARVVDKVTQALERAGVTVR